MLIGIDNLLAFDRLPVLTDGVQVGYEGSIDKRGGNADWDWELYRDQRGEWVLFDVDGPGCIYNFVQHRYPTSEQPTFRFYFDGESEPSFEITPEQFGVKPPFVKPLADVFVGDDDPPRGRGPIWVVRSFVPMPFAKSCRVTSTVRLLGHDKALGEGGWGHIVYHRYTTAEGVTTFTGAEDYAPLLAMWNAVGDDPKATDGNVEQRTETTIEAGTAATLLDRRGAGSIAAIRLEVNRFERRHLHTLQLRLTWDNEAAPAVLAPLGAFFGNEIGRHAQRYLSHGMTTEGKFYCYWPMPFWTSARVELANDDEQPVEIAARVEFKPDASAYPPESCGYFRTTRYFPSTVVTPGWDTVLADVAGRGRIVGATITGLPHMRRYVSCEGDVRVHIDGIATPTVESDGSESWACYGWGFPSPGQQNPVSGYDGTGRPHCAWSMTRLCLGDGYPFYKGFLFGIEAGDANDHPMRHSGLVFYYGRPEPTLLNTDEINIGLDESEKAHDLAGEGVFEQRRFLEAYDERGTRGHFLKDSLRTVGRFSEFTAKIDPRNVGVRLRRRSDQDRGRQRARVFVDGALVTERTWYVADRNPYRRWLEDEFEIPPAYVAGKDSIRVRLEFVPAGDAEGWSEARYEVYSHLPPFEPLPPGVAGGPPAGL